jgi:hypothetical protein
MRNVVASIAVLVALCTFAIGIRFNTTGDRPNWRESVIAYSAPTVPLEFDREITYPSKRYPGETETDDGPTQYLLHHRLAWDECVYYFYRDWPWLDSPAWSADETNDKWGPWVIGAPDHINDARRDGWYAAANKLRKLLQSTTPEKLREELPQPQFSVNITIAIIALAFTVAAFLVVRNAKKHNQRLHPSGDQVR